MSFNSPYVEVPTPNLGTCSNTGKWPDSSYINSCKACISQSNSDYPQFFCDGQCLKKFNLNGSCSLNSLVAKTIDQCYKPCYQVAAPSLNNNCQDDFDCNSGSKCINGACVLQNGQLDCQQKCNEIQSQLMNTQSWDLETVTRYKYCIECSILSANINIDSKTLYNIVNELTNYVKKKYSPSQSFSDKAQKDIENYLLKLLSQYMHNTPQPQPNPSPSPQPNPSPSPQPNNIVNKDCQYRCNEIQSQLMNTQSWDLETVTRYKYCIECSILSANINIDSKTLDNIVNDLTNYVSKKYSPSQSFSDKAQKDIQNYLLKLIPKYAPNVNPKNLNNNSDKSDDKPTSKPNSKITKKHKNNSTWLMILLGIIILIIIIIIIIASYKN